MAFVDQYLSNNQHFAAENSVDVLSIYPAGGICVLTCLDPRTDPAAFLEINLGDAAVIRNAGGRVTQTVIDDLALIAYLSETKLKPGDGPLFEVVVIHHNKCGTHFLADPSFRGPFAQLSGIDEADLIAEAVTDPSATVAMDVALLLDSDVLSRRISVSGHVYDVDTGMVTTVVPTTRMPVQSA
jgi:carbonic anhydrase